MQNRKKNSGREGMTLIEVMLVLFILMTLAAVGMLAVRNLRLQAFQSTARMEIGNLRTLVELYENNIGWFPESLNDLCECPASVDPTVWTKVAKWDKPPLDPWYNEYNYVYPGSGGIDTFDIWSSGPDGQPGTEDDIWPLK